MRHFLLLSTFLCYTTLLLAQSDLLLDVNQTRIQKQKTAMGILGTWAIGNIAVGGILSTRQEGEAKYFNQMNAGWNVINLAIAGFGYYGALKADPAAFDLYESLQEQHKLQKVLLFNAGLDIGYMMGGAYLIERSKNTTDRPERLSGFGKAIVLQGAFLFTFDLITYFVLASDNEMIRPLLSSDGVGVMLRF
jgi:hypothetical protein